MDLKELGIGIIQNITASIPTLMVLATQVGMGLNSLKKRSKETADAVVVNKEEMKNGLSVVQDSVKKSLEKNGADLNNHFNGFRKDLVGLFNTKMVAIEEQSLQQAKEFAKVQTQNNILVKNNKVFMDTIVTLVAKDPALVSAGIATKITTNIHSSMEEMLAVKDQLVPEVHLLKKSLREYETLFGKEELEKMLKESGYEIKKEEVAV